jgi:hypothetical protein
MPLFISTLREGGPAFTIEEVEHGFLNHRVAGRGAGFNDIARLVIEKSGPYFAAFPRSDGRWYDCVHVIPLDEY